MKLVLVALAIAAAATAVPVAVALTADTADCADFATQEDAQAHYLADRTDPDHLDANHNGIACEAFPYPHPAPSAGTAPDGVPPVPPVSHPALKPRYTPGRPVTVAK